MVRGRLRSFVNIIQLPGVRMREKRASEVIAAGVRAYGVEWSMLLRVAVVCACIFGAGLTAAVSSVAEELGPEQARAFVVGQLFSYNCFEGTAGVGRIFADGSVVGTIRMRGQGQVRFAALPAGTIRVDGASMCAHLPGLPITPCFKVDKIDYKSFRGSLSGLGFAYCDFNQRNPRTQLINGPAEQPAATPINTRPVLRPSLQE
jgi:hypothetical protein